MNILRKLQEKRIQKRLDEFNKSGMLRYFHYDFGRMRGDRVSYTVKPEGDNLLLTVQKIDYARGDSEESEYDIPPIVMQQIKTIIRENYIFVWKGFDKHNSMVEGDSFSLRAQFDNYNIVADGASMMPTGFDEANKAICNFFDEMIKGV